MALRGDLVTMGADDLLDWLNRRFLCGTLVVRNQTVERSFSFDSGYCTSVSSSVLSERLGELLIYKRLIAAQTLEDAFSVQNETGVSIGKIMLMIGAISEDDLQVVIMEKITESLLDILAWPHGEFVFRQSFDKRPVSEYDVPVDLKSCLEGAQKRYRRWEQIRRFFEPKTTVRATKHDKLPKKLDDWSRQLASRLAEEHSISDLITEIPMYSFQIQDRLLNLLDEGHLLRTSHEPQQIDPMQLLHDARELADKADFSGALAKIDLVISRDSKNVEARALKQELRKKAFRVSFNQLVGHQRNPKVDQKLLKTIQSSLSEFEKSVLHMIDGNWDVLSVIHHGGIDPVDTTLFLHRMVSEQVVRFEK